MDDTPRERNVIRPPQAVLEAFGLQDAAEIVRAGGTAGVKWAVTGPKGRFVVRVRPTQFSAQGPTRFDHAVLLQLGREGLPAPEPLVRPNGLSWFDFNGSVYEALSWVEGEPFVPGDTAAIAGLGRFLAAFHGAFHQGLPAGKEGWQREDHPDALMPYLGILRSLAETPAQRDDLAVIDRQLDRIRRQLDNGLYASLHPAVIHGDMHIGNVRFRRGEVAAVYDMDYTSLQAAARDLADGVIFFASRRRSMIDADDIASLTQPFEPDLGLCRTLFAAYQQGADRLLSAAEWQALPLLIRSRWVQMRLRGSRKVPRQQKVSYALAGFEDVLIWLDGQAEEFFHSLQPKN